MVGGLPLTRLKRTRLMWVVQDSAADNHSMYDLLDGTQ